MSSIKCYYVTVETCHNKTFIGSHRYSVITQESMVDNEIDITWNNLDEIYEKYAPVVLFNIWNFKKGRRISFFTDKIFNVKNYADIKEWKSSELNIKLKFSYREYEPTLQEVLSWSDNKKSILWLKEHGIELLKET